MTEAPVTREALELAFRDYLAESRRERTSRFSPDMLAWLALPPQWTGRLATQAHFPSWDPTFPDAAAKEGLCAKTQAPLTDRPPWYAAEVGARLAAYLPADSLTGLLDEVAAIRDQHAQARVLAAMTSSLPGSLLPRAAEVANGLDDPAARTRALLATSAAQPPAEAAVTARLALDVAARMEDPGDRAETLLQVADQGRLDDEARQELSRAILATLPELAYESERSSILVRATPYLTAQQVEQALAAALGLRAAEYRIEALAGVSAQLPDKKAVQLLRDEIPAIPTISTEIGRDRATKTLARRLADCGAADLANSTALTLTDEAARETALQAVAGSLASAGDLGQAAEATTAVMTYGKDSPNEVTFLSSLANRLASADRSIAAGVAERARQAAATLASIPANARALVSLVTALVRTDLEANGVAERALEATARVSGAKDRYQLYRRLFPGPAQVGQGPGDGAGAGRRAEHRQPSQPGRRAGRPGAASSCGAAGDGGPGRPVAGGQRDRLLVLDAERPGRRFSTSWRCAMGRPSCTRRRSGSPRACWVRTDRTIRSRPQWPGGRNWPGKEPSNRPRPQTGSTGGWPTSSRTAKATRR